MSPDKNPHFNHISRAPYELGNLLKGMPPDVSMYEPQSADTCLMAAAAQQHATNGLSTLLDGLEALGSLMVIAGSCDDLNVGNDVVRSLGAMIEHIAVDIQHLYEVEQDMSAIVKSNEKRTGKAGAK